MKNSGSRPDDWVTYRLGRGKYLFQCGHCRAVVYGFVSWEAAIDAAQEHRHEEHAGSTDAPILTGFDSLVL
jgi:hypothetical protein